MNDYESAILPPRFAPLVRRFWLKSQSVTLLVVRSFLTHTTERGHEIGHSTDADKKMAYLYTSREQVNVLWLWLLLLLLLCGISIMEI